MDFQLVNDIVISNNKLIYNIMIWKISFVAIMKLRTASIALKNSLLFDSIYQTHNEFQMVMMYQGVIFVSEKWIKTANMLIVHVCT